MGQYFDNVNLPSDIKKINVELLGKNFTFLEKCGIIKLGYSKEFYYKKESDIYGK